MELIPTQNHKHMIKDKRSVSINVVKCKTCGHDVQVYQCDSCYNPSGTCPKCRKHVIAFFNARNGKVESI